MSSIDFVKIAQEYKFHNEKCLNLPSEIYFRILEEEGNYKIVNVAMNKHICNQLKTIFENSDLIRLTYDEQLFKIFDYDHISLKEFLKATKGNNDYDLFKQTIINKSDNSNTIQNLIRSCWVNPFLISLVDYKARINYYFVL